VLTGQYKADLSEPRADCGMQISDCGLVEKAYSALNPQSEIRIPQFSSPGGPFCRSFAR